MNTREFTFATVRLSRAMSQPILQLAQILSAEDGECYVCAERP
jgi:hypothetical protein